MVLEEFLSNTRRRWLKAFRLFKKNKHRKSLASPGHGNRVSPDPDACAPPYSGTIDASAEITIERFCRCSITPRPSTPPFPTPASPDSTYENASYYSDSAYDTDRSSHSSTISGKEKVSYATVTYFNVKDNDDTCSVTTELTWLEVEVDDEKIQNVVNEKIELMTSL